jgi:hypothetical protein
MPDFPMLHGMRARAVHVVREGVIERPDVEAGDSLHHASHHFGHFSF